MRAPKKKTKRRAAPAKLFARLSGHVMLDAEPSGDIVARFQGYALRLGTFGAGVAARAEKLRAGLPLGSLAAGKRDTDKEMQNLVARLARLGFLEYRLGRAPDGEDLVAIEPQVPTYRPQIAALRDSDTIVLSRFAYLRRRGGDMVLESPRAGALFTIGDPRIAALLTTLATPQTVRELRLHDSFPGRELLGLLVDADMLFKLGAAAGAGLRPDEGDHSLVMWDFHDLLFHMRSTEGRHANPVGGLYPYAGTIEAPPAVRPPWPGAKIDLEKLAAPDRQVLSPAALALRERRSTRSFDDARPITLAELSRFLDASARVLSTWQDPTELGEGGPAVEHTLRPYPSAGASHALELYLTVDKCDGLARGFYHYDAGGHVLTPIEVRAADLDAQLKAAEQAMGVTAAPHILITIAARFGRVSWKYSSIAYALILKDTGVLTQTLYLMAADLGLGGCAIGSTSIDLFATMTGLDFHVEGAVGQFALGRGAPE